MKRTAIVLAILLLGAPPVPVEAGGWVSVSLDAFPEGVVKGAEQEVSFVLRQHGVHPVNGSRAELQFTHEETGEYLTVEATDTGRDGRYIARFSLPKADLWDWNVWTWARQHPMPALHVSFTAPAQPNTRVAPKAEPVGSFVNYGPAPELVATPFTVLGFPLLVASLLLGLRSRFALSLTRRRGHRTHAGWDTYVMQSRIRGLRSARRRLRAPPPRAAASPGRSHG